MDLFSVLNPLSCVQHETSCPQDLYSIGVVRLPLVLTSQSLVLSFQLQDEISQNHILKL